MTTASTVLLAEDCDCTPDDRLSPITSSRRIPALDGLRGIAIFLVLLWHTIFHTSFSHYPLANRLLAIGHLSWSGVDLFFVLSGFLIGGILLDNRSSPNFFKTFYLRRAYRILPLYFLVVTLCWIMFQAGRYGWTPYGRMDLFKGGAPWWSFFTFTQNFWMARMGGFSGGGLGLSWSLAVEEQFYLTLPFIVRRVSPTKLIYLVIAVIFGAPLLRALLICHFAHGPFAAYVLMPCRADALGCGVLCAILVRKKRIWDFLVARREWIYALSVVLAIGLAIITYRGDPLFSGVLYGIQYSVLAFFYAAVLLIAVTREDQFVKAVFCNRYLMQLGIVAYGTYLLHYLFMNGLVFFLGSLGIFPLAVVLLGAPLLGVVIAVIVARISWRMFERPLVVSSHEYKY